MQFVKDEMGWKEVNSILDSGRWRDLQITNELERR